MRKITKPRAAILRIFDPSLFPHIPAAATAASAADLGHTPPLPEIVEG
jgi:hypothetical protein